MKRLKTAAVAALLVLLTPSQAFANGMWKLEAAGNATLAGVFGCIVVACAIWLPRSKWGLASCLVIGGTLGAVVSVWLADVVGRRSGYSLYERAVASLYGAVGGAPPWLIAAAVLLGVILAGCANNLPRSKWGLICWPVLGGIVAETSLAMLYLPKGNIFGVVMVAGLATSLLGGSLGLISLLVATVISKSRSKSS
jgi:hypothetical protein